MQRKELEAAAFQITYLRGLIAVPAGLCAILIGLGNLRWGVFAHDWIFVGALALVLVAVLLARRYYDANFGRATFARRQQRRFDIAAAVLSAVALMGGVLLDSSLDLPVSLFTICVALSMLAWFAVTAQLSPHRIAGAGALLIAGALPVWGGVSDPVSVAWLLIGLAVIIIGLLDHAQLVRTYGSARRHDRQDSSVEA
ncbi:MAG: hypothetical protein ABIQ09_16015 [Jatrophihabitantaceae bacterium]